MGSKCNQTIRTVVKILCLKKTKLNTKKNKNIFLRNFFFCRKSLHLKWPHHEHFRLTLLNSHIHSHPSPNEFYFIGPKATWCVFASVSALELIKIIWWRKSTVSSVCFVHRWTRTARMTCYKFLSVQSAY